VVMGALTDWLEPPLSAAAPWFDGPIG